MQTEEAKAEDAGIDKKDEDPITNQENAAEGEEEIY